MRNSLNLILLSAALFSVSVNLAEGRTWTDRTGRAVEAEFIAIADGKVRIKRASDGKLFDIPLETLSDEDRAFVKSKANDVPATKTDDVVKEFRGDFQTGLMSFVSGSFHGIPIFIDRTRPSFIKAADDAASEKLLSDICKNPDELRRCPGGARRLFSQINPLDKSEGLHIAVFTLASVPVTNRIKSPGRFVPGTITAIADIKRKFGEPSEIENWNHEEFKSWIGLNGVVCWWGSVGIASAEDGEITHILVREKEPLDK